MKAAALTTGHPPLSSLAPRPSSLAANAVARAPPPEPRTVKPGYGACGAAFVVAGSVAAGAARRNEGTIRRRVSR